MHSMRDMTEAATQKEAEAAARKPFSWAISIAGGMALGLSVGLGLSLGLGLSVGAPLGVMVGVGVSGGLLLGVACSFWIRHDSARLRKIPGIVITHKQMAANKLKIILAAYQGALPLLAATLPRRAI